VSIKNDPNFHPLDLSPSTMVFLEDFLGETNVARFNQNRSRPRRWHNG
jgi:hypothetical protein